MKINYKPNPFHTTVELDDRDKQMILLAYQNEEYTQLLCSLHMRLEGKYEKEPLTDNEVIKKEVDKWGAICNLNVDSPEIVQYISYINESHFGDCTCFACSCIRCQIEDMIGINTIAGLGKHQANKVLGAFGKEGDRTIDEAIESLEKDRDYVKPDNWPDSVGYEVHIPRWENERITAIAWLNKYKEEHGF